MLYFAVHHLDADGGIQITGSHNPPDYNGFKMMLGKKPFYGAQIQELGRDRRARAPTRAGGGRRIDSSACSTPMSTRLVQDYHGRPRAVGGLGRRQRRRGRGDERAGRPAARPARTAVRRDRRPLPQPPSRPDRAARTSSDLIRAVRAERRRARHRASTATATGSAWSTARAGSCSATRSCRSWRPTCWRAIPARPIIADVKTSQAFFDEIARLGGAAR